MSQSGLIRESVEVTLEYAGDALELGFRSPADMLDEAARFYVDFRKSGAISEAAVRRIATRAMKRAISGIED